ncbi:MAG: hypothetical protein HY794_10025 [Desulfarculus sp.]|nr:hypothetical protein [Desulfarculus sp.]
MMLIDGWLVGIIKGNNFELLRKASIASSGQRGKEQQVKDELINPVVRNKGKEGINSENQIYQHGNAPKKRVGEGKTAVINMKWLNGDRFVHLIILVATIWSAWITTCTYKDQSYPGKPDIIVHVPPVVKQWNGNTSYNFNKAFTEAKKELDYIFNGKTYILDKEGEGYVFFSKEKDSHAKGNITDAIKILNMAVGIRFSRNRGDTSKTIEAVHKTKIHVEYLNSYQEVDGFKVGLVDIMPDNYLNDMIQDNARSVYYFDVPNEKLLKHFRVNTLANQMSMVIVNDSTPESSSKEILPQVAPNGP